MKWGLTKRSDDSLGVESFRKDLLNLFDNLFETGPSSLMDSGWMPTVDVEDGENAIRVKAEIPGIDEKDLNVTLQNNLLTISGEKKEERNENGKKFMLRERRYGSFQRTIALPEGIMSDSISATFKNGVLRIEIPKAGEAKANRIKINVT